MTKYYIIKEDSIEHDRLICALCANTAWEYMPIKPKSKTRHSATPQIQYFCGKCKTMLHGKPNYCSECGFPILWKG